jgi:glycosyltransferase involved in cell wall biosynthesis
VGVALAASGFHYGERSVASQGVYCWALESEIFLKAREFAEMVMPNSQLRVLHLASGDLWAGAENQLYQLVLSLLKRPEVAVAVALLNEGELARRLRHAKVEVYVLDEAKHGMLALLYRLVNVVRRLHPDLIHTHRMKENLLGALCSVAFRGVACLRTVHGSLEDSGASAPSSRRRIALMLDRVFVARLQSCAIAVSQPLADELARRLPVKSIRMIPNGIDVNGVLRAAAALNAIERAGSAIGVCFVGRLVPVKRVDLFLRAAAAVVRQHPHKYQFYVVGDGPLRASLEELARVLELQGHCTFVGFQPNCMPLLRAMRALVLTSDHEGTPMVALEALALGVPLVAHAVGGLVPLLQSPRQGLLVGSQDPDKIARAIIAVAAPIADTLRQHPSLLPAEYTVERCAGEYVRLYEELAGGRSGVRVR